MPYFIFRELANNLFIFRETKSSPPTPPRPPPPSELGARDIFSDRSAYKMYKEVDAGRARLTREVKWGGVWGGGGKKTRDIHRSTGAAMQCSDTGFLEKSIRYTYLSFNFQRSSTNRRSA